MLNVLGIFTALGALMLPVRAGWNSLDGCTPRETSCARRRRRRLSPRPCGRAEPARAAHHAAPSSAWRLLGDNRVRLLTVMLALDFGSEAVVCGWIATYTLGTVPEAPATAMVAVYWGALMAGRAVWPSVLSRMPKLPFVAAASLCVAVSCLGISQAYSTATLSIAVACAGFTLSPLAPTLLSVAGDWYPRQTGTVFGLLLALGQIGSVTLPWIVGRMAIAVGLPTRDVRAGSRCCARHRRDPVAACAPHNTGFEWTRRGGGLVIARAVPLRSRRYAHRHDRSHSAVVRTHLRAARGHDAIAGGADRRRSGDRCLEALREFARDVGLA